MANPNNKPTFSATAASALHDLLFCRDFKAYLILDRARDPRIGKLLIDTKSYHKSLYGGKLAEQLEEFGPELAEIREGEQIFTEFVNAGWGQAWGMIVLSKSDFETVRGQLRRLLGVEMPDGGRALFRFYDPRVLRHFLPTCTPEERDHFFGNVIHSYLVENPEEDTLLQITNSKDIVSHPPLPLVFNGLKSDRAELT